MGNPLTMNDAEKTSQAQDTGRTDLNLWRLESQKGRHYWHYLTQEQASQRPMSHAEKWYLGLETVGFFRKGVLGKLH